MILHVQHTSHIPVEVEELEEDRIVKDGDLVVWPDAHHHNDMPYYVDGEHIGERAGSVPGAKFYRPVDTRMLKVSLTGRVECFVLDDTQFVEPTDWHHEPRLAYRSYPISNHHVPGETVRQFKERMGGGEVWRPKVPIIEVLSLEL